MCVCLCVCVCVCKYILYKYVKAKIYICMRVCFIQIRIYIYIYIYIYTHILTHTHTDIHLSVLVVGVGWISISNTSLHCLLKSMEVQCQCIFGKSWLIAKLFCANFLWSHLATGLEPLTLGMMIHVFYHSATLIVKTGKYLSLSVLS